MRINNVNGGVLRRRAWLVLAVVGAALGLALGLVLAAMPASAAPQAFDPPRFQTKARGDISYASNTLMTCPDGGSCSAARAGTNNANNNSYQMKYVDVDDNPNTFNSSQANFTLPDGGEVLFAGLYWGARSNSPQRDQVLFKTPELADYQQIQGQEVGSIAAGAGSAGEIQAYEGFANVTNFVQQAGTATYTVANVQAKQGPDQFAGWSLVVAYRDPAASPRELSIFDGFDYIADNRTDKRVDIPIDGFTTPPGGDVQAKVGAIAYEGDLGLAGDSLQLKGDKSAAFTTLSNSLNPANNFFNSSITDTGTRRTDKAPDYVNQLGYDADILSTNNVLANRENGATVRLTTNNDTYFPGVVTTAIELYDPDIDLAKTGRDVNGGDLLPGDAIEYTLTADNNGRDGSANTVINDAIPEGTTYVPGSLNVTDGPNAGAKTDIPDNDQAEFDAAQGDRGTVRFRVGTGADGQNGGALEPDGQTPDSSTVTFRVRVNPGAGGPSTISNFATADYSGETQDQTKRFRSISPTVDLDVERRADLSINKTDDEDRDPVRVGDRFDYFLDVTNNGPANSSITTVADRLPNGIEFLSSFGSPNGCDEANGTVTCDLGEVPVGQTVRIKIVVRANGEPRTVTNTAEVNTDASDPDPAPDNNESSEETTIGKALNRPPNAKDDSARTRENVPVRIQVLKNDSDPDGNQLSVQNFAQPKNGRVSRNPDGTLTYKPNRGFSGRDSFTYTISDGNGGTDTATVKILVSAAQVPPTPPPSSDPCKGVGSAKKNILGTPGDDVLIGTNGKNTIIGFGGNDRIYACGGNDSIIGNDGKNQLFGGAGDDSIDGGKDNDLIVGGSGRDAMNGSGGRDRLYAKDGNKDSVNGGSDRDICRVDRRDRDVGCP